MWDIKEKCDLDYEEAEITEYYLNHVGYKVPQLHYTLKELHHQYYLNHVGYKEFLN